MDPRYGHYDNKDYDLRLVYDKHNDKAYISSGDVKNNMATVNLQSLYSRGVEKIDKDVNKKLYTYFHKVSNRGNRSILFDLDDLAKAETLEKFNTIFTTQRFFRDLQKAYKDHCEDRDATDDSETFSQENEETNIERILKNRLDQIQSALSREIAIERMINDPAVQEEAVKRAAESYVNNQGQIIIDEFEKQHAEHMSAMNTRYLEMEKRLMQDHESAKKARDGEIERERNKLKRIREKIESEIHRCGETLDKRRLLEKECEILRQKAEAQARTVASYRPYANRRPVISNYVREFMTKK